MSDPAPPPEPTAPAKAPMSPTTVILLIAGAAVALLLLCVALGVILAIAIPVIVRSQASSQERAGVAQLRAIATIEELWRQDDVDKNGVADYWTGDVSGLYRVERPPSGSGMPAGLLDEAIARADDVKLGGGAAMPGGSLPTPGARSSGLLEMRETASNAGFFVRALTTDAEDAPYARDPDGDGNPWTHETRFGFSAHPAAYGSGARSTFVVNEEGVIYGSDLGSGAPAACTAWPGPDPSAHGWKPAR